jgi:subtilisin family serine protease
LPNLPSLPTERLDVPLDARAVERRAEEQLRQLRRTTLRKLLAEHPDVLEADPAGEPIVRGELLLLSPSAALLAAAQTQGFSVLRESSLDGLDELRSVVLQVPRGRSMAQALATLRALDPTLVVDFNHLYTRSGEVDARSTAPAASMPAKAAADSRRVGLVDGGVEASHPALRGGTLRRWGCDGAPKPNAHGTAVASLLIGRDGRFAGALPGAVLYAADVYCDQPTGGSAERVAQALAWMAREQVPVVNVSLVGPPNRLLEQAVQALARRGHLVVAAVGNDGPSAPPLYPAAYAEVVGVTGVNSRRRVLPEAAQGPQVVFSAPGAELAVAASGDASYGTARGTSFAAPFVSGLLAAQLPRPDAAAARVAVQALVTQAQDLGDKGRDTVFGWGLVGESVRTAPDRVQARVSVWP